MEQWVVHKGLYYAALLLIVALYINTVRLGIASHGKSHKSSVVNSHKWSVGTFVSVLAVAFCLIENHVRDLGGAVNDLLFRVHLRIVLPLAGVFILMLIFNGERYPVLHKWLWLISLPLVFGMILTGFPLVHLRF